jgi:hypothetical protein
MSLNHLLSLYGTFSQCYLSSADLIPRSSENEPIELPQLICPIIDFMGTVTRGGKARGWFSEQNLSALISSVFAFLQMTNDDVSSIADLTFVDFNLP